MTLTTFKIMTTTLWLLCAVARIFICYYKKNIKFHGEDYAHGVLDVHADAKGHADQSAGEAIPHPQGCDARLRQVASVLQD